MERHRDRGDSIISNLVGVAVLGAAVVGFLEFKGITNFFPDKIELGSDPTSANAAVDQNSYVNLVDFDINCLKKVGVLVDVEAFKNGPIGDGVLKKKFAGDFLLCSDNNEIGANGKEIVNPITNKVTEVDVVLSGVKVTQERINKLDILNCVDGNIGDTREQMEEKAKEYLEKAKKGKAPDCDDGFDVTQLGGSPNLATAKDTAESAAQLAIAMDANPKKIIAEADQKIVEQVTALLSQKSRYADATINVTVERPTDTQDLQARLDAANKDDFAMFKKVEVGSDDKGNYLYVEAHDGAHATVRLGGYANLDIDQITISDPKPIAVQGQG